MNQLLKIADNPEIQTGSPFTVVLSKDQIVGEREIMMLNVENHEGLTARFFVSVKVENGRPKVTVTTKPYAGKDEEVSKTVAGSCNLL